MSDGAGAARAPESGGIRDSKVVCHPAGHPSLGIGQRGIERPLVTVALPNDAALVQNPNE